MKHNPITRFFKLWLKPRATDRDTFLRERTIRIISMVVFAMSALSLSFSIFFFQDEWVLVSYPTLFTVAMTLAVISVLLVNRARITAAGWAITALFFTFAIGNSIINDGYIAQFNVPILLLACVLAHSLLPSRAIWYVCAAGVVVSVAQPFDLTDFSHNISVTVLHLTLFMLVAFFLYQGAKESEDRLDAVQVALADLEVAKHLAEQANRSKSSFLASMSHDLRTPLNAIIGYVDILRLGMAGEIAPQQQSLLEDITVNNQRLLALINDLLDVAKIESGTITLLETTADPHQVINQTVDSMRSLALAKNIELKVDFTDYAPSMVLLDVTKFQQVLTNLVGNAIKFTDHGGVYISVDSTSEHYWQFSVRDTGIGMPEDAPNYIFEKFRQVDSSDTRKYQGTGLGLAIVKGMVDLFEGEIKVQSRLGVGTTFTVTLPRHRSKHTQEHIQHEQPTPQYHVN